MQNNHITIALIAIALSATPSTKPWIPHAGKMRERARARRIQTRKDNLENKISTNTGTYRQEAVLLRLSSTSDDYGKWTKQEQSNYQNTPWVKDIASRIVDCDFTLDQLRNAYTAHIRMLTNNKNMQPSGTIATMYVSKYNDYLDAKEVVTVEKLKCTVNEQLKNIAAKSPKYKQCFNSDFSYKQPLELIQNHYKYLLKNDPQRHLWSFSWECKEGLKQANMLYVEYKTAQDQQELCIQSIKKFVEQNKVKLDNKKLIIGLKTDAQLQSEFDTFLA
ncbi:hypothetical protein HOL34_01980 [bacterium]|nr:hypothetical protein [bacterium]MBT4577680.1 hypothetical protein [bacterium]MBT6528853.1 hypothetical protein [bacterium]